MIAINVDPSHFCEFVLLSLALAAIDVSAGASDDLEKTLFRKPLAGGRELAIVRGPRVQRTTWLE